MMVLEEISKFFLEAVGPLLEKIAPYMPGEVTPVVLEMEFFQRALIAAILATIVGGFFGSFLIMRNLALMGDGLAHVSFGGIAVGMVLGGVAPLWYALIFSTIAAILIHEMQTRELLTGDASIAIFLTGMLALGLVVLSISDVGITSTVEGYMFGSLLIIDNESLGLIIVISTFALSSLYLFRGSLLATTIDAVSAKVQGIPVRWVGLWFSITTAAVVVSMVQIVGTLLVTALLVTPAATGQLVGRSFKGCMMWTQFFGLLSVFLGLYFSNEMETGSGSMIALISAIIFAIVLLSRTVYLRYIMQPVANG